MERTDHAASLEPDGMRKLVRDLSIAYSSLQNKPKDVLDIEVDKEKLKNFVMTNLSKFKVKTLE